MKRAAIALVCGALLASGSIGLALLPNALNTAGEGYNRGLQLAWFLGGSLQGTVVAVVWLLALQLLRPSDSTRRMLLVAGVVFVFAVLLPCPSILSGAWADGLVGVYAILAWAGTAMCAWVSPFGRGPRGRPGDPEQAAAS